MVLISTIVVSYLLTCVTWFLYLAIMHLKKLKDAGGLTTPQKIVGYPVLYIVGFPLDVLYNWLVGTLLFIEFPRELLFTARCARHLKSKTFRGRIANWVCKHFLEPFDAGHCK